MSTAAAIRAHPDAVVNRTPVTPSTYAPKNVVPDDSVAVRHVNKPPASSPTHATNTRSGHRSLQLGPLRRSYASSVRRTGSDAYAPTNNPGTTTPNTRKTRNAINRSEAPGPVRVDGADDTA